MTVLARWLIDYFLPSSQQTEEEQVVLIETALANKEPMEKINTKGWIAVLTYSRCPNVVIKICDPKRAEIADWMRGIIEDNSLNLLHVPRKWVFSKGVIAEKQDLYFETTTKIFSQMTAEERRPYIAQFWTFVKLTGFADIRDNVALEKKAEGVARLVIFDTGSGCINKDTASTNFFSQAPFNHTEMLCVVREERGRRDSNSQLPA